MVNGEVTMHDGEQTGASTRTIAAPRQRLTVTQQPMVKAFNFFKRKPGLGVEEFRKYWLNEHAAIIRAIPELRRYTASITLPSAYKNREPLYDGISEAWFDDEATLRGTADSAPRRAASADDAKFVDMSTTGSIVVDEVIQKEGRAADSAVKMLSMLTRMPGMDVAAFQAYWRTHHGPLAAKIPQARRYVQCHVRPSAYADGVSPATTASRRCGSTTSTRCAIPATPTSIARSVSTSRNSSRCRSRS